MPGNFLDRGESHASSWRMIARCSSIKNFEDAAALFRVDAGAMVADVETHQVADAVSSDLDWSTLWPCITSGIGDEVVKDLYELGPRQAHRGKLSNLDSQTALRELFGKVEDHLGNDGTRIDRFGWPLNLSDPGQREQVLFQCQHFLAGGRDLGQIAQLVFTQPVAATLAKHIRVSQNQRERGAQIV